MPNDRYKTAQIVHACVVYTQPRVSSALEACWARGRSVGRQQQPNVNHLPERRGDAEGRLPGPGGRRQRQPTAEDHRTQREGRRLQPVLSPHVRTSLASSQLRARVHAARPSVDAARARARCTHLLAGRSKRWASFRIMRTSASRASSSSVSEAWAAWLPRCSFGAAWAS